MRLALSSRTETIRSGRLRLRWCLAGWLLAMPALAGTFGTVVPIQGHASDVALDEKRGLLYVANMMANRVDVISTTTKTVLVNSTIPASPYPASVSLSPDGQFLVATHYRNFQDPTTWSNIISVRDLTHNVSRTLTLPYTPMAVSFGADGKALIITTKDFQLLEPASGTLEVLDTVAGVTGKTLPVEWGTFPPEIHRASMAPSGDRQVIFGVAEAGAENREVIFRYVVATRALRAVYWISSPPLGPRTMAVNQDGSICLTGWGLFLRGEILLAQFRNATGSFNTGGLALDSTRGPYGTVYAQYDQAASGGSTPKRQSVRAAAPAGPPVLLITDADNLTVRERLNLQEHLGGKAVLNSDGSVMYAVSDSGVTILPVGALAQHPRVRAQQEDVVFRGNFCDRRTMSQEIEIVDPGGGKTEFSLQPTDADGNPDPRIGIVPSSGVTPAKVRVFIDPSLFQNYRGTVLGLIQVRSRAAVNIPPAVRVLINNREPDQRGTIVNVPGKLVDVLADPIRNRYYIVREDTNEVQVYDATNYNRVATFRTGNTPTQVAITYDRRLMLIGNDDSQVSYVYDLDNMRRIGMVVFPPGHYPQSIACSSNALLAFSRVAGPTNTIDRIDLMAVLPSEWYTPPQLPMFRAIELPNLGLYKNALGGARAALAVTPSGTKIFIVVDNGNVMLYDAVADSFIASRKDFAKLSGAHAALANDRYLVDNNLLNASLVKIQEFENDSGKSSGFAMIDQYGVRTTALSSSNPGTIQKVEFGKPASIRPTRVIEAPLLVQETTVTVPGECDTLFGQTVCKPPSTQNVIIGAPFTRTLVPLPNRSAIISMSQTGYTILPWNYDAWVSEPRLEKVASFADGSDKVAPGMLVTVTGTNLSLTQYATGGIPLPTILGESCLTVNGIPIPITLISPTQINAQLPFLLAGDATMTLRSPAGVSNNFTFNVLSAAPGVFRTAGSIPTVVRVTNGELVTPSNPIHPEDWIVIYAAGLGATSPLVAPGVGAPSDPLAWVLSKPEVTLGDEPLGLDYVGLVPGQVGVYQINAYVPFWAPQGWEIPLKITTGGISTTLNVRVVK